MTGYVRQSSADIVPTAVVRAAPINNELNALRDAFEQSAGHKHDGTAAEGHYVPLIADSDAKNKVAVDTGNNRIGVFVEVGGVAVEQVRIQDGAVVPVTDNDMDLGTSSLEFKDLYIDGTANIDSLIADTADINAGTIDNTVVGATTPAAGSFTTLNASNAFTYGGVTLNNAVTGTGDMVLSTSPTLVTPNLGTPSTLVGTNITGTAAGLTAGNVTTNANLTGAVTSVGNATSLGSFTSSQLAGALTDETGSGSVVFATSPTLVTPALGTPSSATLTNATGLPIATGVSGLGTGVATFLATPSSANLKTAVTDETGSGALVFATSPTLVTPDLGTPSALVGTNITGTAAGLTAGNVTTNANLTGAVTSVGNATSLGSFTSSQLAGALTDETGSGAAVFATSPTLVTPALGTPSSATLTNATGLPISTGVTGLGTGVATFLATPSSANLAAAVTDETGTGALVFGTNPTITGGSLTNTVVSYLPAGAGAVATDVQTKLREGVSVKDFGAVGNGIADDTAAIQAAIDANYGGSLYVPPGTYLVSDTITIVQGIQITGVPGKSIFKASPSIPQDSDLFSAQSSSIPTRTVYGLTIIGIVFDGDNLPAQRWLQTSSGTTVTDPEADYVMGTGALASGISGVSLTATLTGGVVTGITIVNGGSGWNGHPVYPYQPNTVPLKFTGGSPTIGAYGFATISGGTITSITISDGGVGYVSAPTVTTSGGYADIELLTTPSVNRRNSNYTTQSSLFRLQLTQLTSITNCVFQNHAGRAITELGGKDVEIASCQFNQVGKNDGPYHAIWTQSYGDPASPGASFTDSENIVIRHCEFRNLERSAVLFAPTKGGKFQNNYIDGYGESAVFTMENLNYNGGYSEITGNTIINGTLTDITSNAIEAGRVKNLLIADNYIENSPTTALVITGTDRVTVKNNRFKNCYATTIEPYGPFSERYTFNAGEMPTAGRTNSVIDGAYISIGTLASIGAKNCIIQGNFFSETRSNYPVIFKQTKSGANNVAGTHVIRDNMVDIPAAMTFYDTSIGTVFEPNMPLWIQNNIGTASAAPVVHTKQFASGETGTYNVVCGFRPSVVHTYAAANNGSVGRSSAGEFSWNAAGTRNDFALILSTTTGTGQQLSLLGSEVARTVTAANVTQFGMEFTRWDELGFTVNVITALEITNVRFVCYP